MSSKCNLDTNSASPDAQDFLLDTSPHAASTRVGPGAGIVPIWLPTVADETLRREREDLERRLKDVQAEREHAKDTNRVLVGGIITYFKSLNDGQLDRAKKALCLQAEDQKDGTDATHASDDGDATTNTETTEAVEGGGLVKWSDSASLQSDDMDLDDDDEDGDSYEPEDDVPSLEEQIDQLIAEEQAKVDQRQRNKASAQTE